MQVVARPPQPGTGTLASVNEHHHVFDVQAFVRQQVSSLNDAAAGGDEVINDEDGLVRFVRSFYYVVASVHHSRVSVDHWHVCR